MNKFKLFMTTVAIAFLFVLPLVSAQGLSVKPAKLGIYRITIPAFGDFVAEKSFAVGNRYDFDLNITLTPTGNFSDIVEYELKSFVLKPNQTQVVKYTLRVSQPGIYDGGFVVRSAAEGRVSNVAYLADIVVYASQSTVPSLLYPTILLILLAVLGYFVYHRFSKKKRSHKTRILFYAMIFFVFLSTVSSVNAAEIAMIVKDRTSLNPTHEQRIYNLLTEWGHDVTLIDGTVSFNYNSFDLIVVAGRPSGGTIGTWVKSIPVNDIPTIAIDSAYLDDWGWTKAAGSSSLSSSDRQKVFIQAIHPTTLGYALNQKVYVHLTQGSSITDLVSGKTNLTYTATAKSDGSLAVIAYANPNTILANGKKVGNHAAIVFFGVHYPNLWTEDAVRLFKNSVDWLTTLDFTPPVTPSLSASWKKGDTSIAYSWSSSNEANIFKYQLQVSNDPSFSTTVLDLTTTDKNFSFSPIQEAKSYYARVRAYNNLNIFGNWSAVVKTVVDSSDMIITIVNPQSGITVTPSSTVLTNVTLKAPKMINGYNCSIFVNDQFIANLTYSSSSSSCSGNVVLPGSVTGLLNFKASATNSVGTTNSTTIQFTASSPSSSSSTSGGSSGGGGSLSIGIISIDVPSEMTAQEDSDYEIIANVKNEGLIPLSTVKVSIKGVDFAADIDPQLINLNIGESQQFRIVLHLPEDSEGTYNVEFRALSYEANAKKKVVLNVVSKPQVPNLVVLDKSIPQFVEGTPSSVSITVFNDGSADAEGTVKVIVPQNWTAEGEQEFFLAIGEQDTISFSITPANTTGNLVFEFSYLKDGRTETFVDSTQVTGEKAQQQFDLSGFFAMISSPEVAIPIGLIAAAIIGFYFRAELVRNALTILNSVRSRPVAQPTERTISFPRRVDFSRNYERWERRHKQKL